MSKTKLKDCPFCGSAPQRFPSGISCINDTCVLGATTLFFGTRDWNKRAPITEFPKLNGHLTDCDMK